MHLPILSLRRSFLALFASFAAPVAAQTTVSVPCAADNTLYESLTGALSNGSGPGLFVGLTGTGAIRRAVLRFDVAATLPANATVIDAVLTLNVAQSSAFLPLPTTGHRLLAAWGEGTSVATGGGGGGGAPSAPNDATWVHTYFSSATWTTAGGDFAATPSFGIALPNSGPCASLPAVAAVADVQNWLDNPAQNFGWLLKTDEQLAATAHRIDSRESTGPKPTLVVTYMLPGQTASFGTGCTIGAGQFTNAWVGTPTGGTTVAIAKTNGPASSVGADFFSLTLDPLGLPLGGTCAVWLPLAEVIPGGVFLTDGFGSGATTFTIPAGYPGYLIACQAAVLDTSPLGFAVSNAALAVLQ